MKTRLLKKVRKRYAINFHPKGVFLYDTFWEGPIWTLEDSHNSWRTRIYRRENVYMINGKLLDWIRKDYGYVKNANTSKIKIWPK